MLVSLVCVGLALRTGLLLRGGRRGRRPRPRELRGRHLRFAKTAVALVLVGAAGGLASAVWLRGMDPLRSLHGAIAVPVLALFATAAILGRRLEQRRSRAFDAHAAAALVAALLAALAAVAGFSILP